ncbi:MAG: M20/M25/M40 family metallo-hydrolase [Intestinimonas sp.]|jgi:amidohydrolase|nr:M20/M25/M40 family metallo-hydrolase [Intestinimonas sp.]
MQDIRESLLYGLRAQLHACPEVSGQEIKTKAALMRFLKAHTSLELVDCGSWFYAVHREHNAEKYGIALRADFDALAIPDGGAAHLCGHDGHASALCGVGLMLEGQTLGRSVYLIFQPAEEIGAGAKACIEIFKKEKIGEIYGAHNLPGLPLGCITTRPGTFACASRGITLGFTGAPTHAAYPEFGISPAPAVGELLMGLPSITDPDRYSGMTLCTVIGIQMGDKTFGAAAANAEAWLTLRAEHDADLSALQERVLSLSRVLADRYHLDFHFWEQDVFPATENTPDNANKVLSLCGGQTLQAPMRWSEDFGWYLKKCSGAFFGIGAGDTHAPLHTADYEYPDELLLPTCNAFWKLIVGE